MSTRTRTHTRIALDGSRDRGAARRAKAAKERRALLALCVLGLSAVLVFLTGWGGIGRSNSVARAAQNSQRVAAATLPVLSSTTAAKSRLSSASTKATDGPSAGATSVTAQLEPMKPAPKPVSTPPAKTVAATPKTAAPVAAKTTPTATKSTPQRSIASTTRASKGTITIETFGYDFGGPPKGSKFVADVRNIQAGNFTQSQSGLQADVRKRVMATAAAKKWHNTMKATWLPNLKAGDKVAIGCARGHHRSVTLAIVFAQDVRAKGFTVKFIHRDLKKTW